MRTSTLCRVASIVLLIAAGCAAQSAAGGGSIQGTVKDASDAAIPGAKIHILHIDTNRATTTAANDEGYFATPPLAIGNYRVRVEAPGMRAWERELLLETGRIVELSPQLVPGAVTETVLVTASIPLVTTSDPTDASTLDRPRIHEL